MRDWLFYLCVGILAALAFHERARWMPQQAPAAPAVVTVEPDPVPALRGKSLPSGSQARMQPTPEPSVAAELANLVAASQRAALAKYPALGKLDSELNIRFSYRYKRLLEDHSTRLQDPSWPLQLADECAQAAGIVTATPPPAAPGLRTARTAPGTVPPSVAPGAPSLRLSPAVPAPAQSLVFHPAGGAPPVTLAAANFGAAAVTSAPKAADALPFVTMDAVNRSSANNYNYNGYYDYGWYDISFRQSVGIDIRVRNMARVPAAVNVRWIFFARNTANNQRFIIATSGKELDLTAGQDAAVSADSPIIHSREANYYGWIGERYLSGSKYEGWLAQLMERGSNRIIKQTGSTSYLEDLAKKTDFSTLLDDYGKKMHGQGSPGLSSTASR